MIDDTLVRPVPSDRRNNLKEYYFARPLPENIRVSDIFFQLVTLHMTWPFQIGTWTENNYAIATPIFTLQNIFA